MVCLRFVEYDVSIIVLNSLELTEQVVRKINKQKVAIVKHRQYKCRHSLLVGNTCDEISNVDDPTQFKKRCTILMSVLLTSFCCMMMFASMYLKCERGLKHLTAQGLKSHATTIFLTDAFLSLLIMYITSALCQSFFCPQLSLFVL